MSLHDTANRFPVRRRFKVPRGLAPRRPGSTVGRDSSETNPSSTGSPLAPVLLRKEKSGLSGREHALLRACLGNDAPGVKAALGDGARPDFLANATDSRDPQRTPLMIAAANGNIDVVDILLGAGANPDLRTHEDLCALTVAVAKKNLAVIDRLMDAGASVNHAVLRVCTTTDRGSAVLRHFVSRGVDVDWRGETGCTLLLDAAERLDADLIRDLIRYGADPNYQDTFGATALHHALGHASITDNRENVRRCIKILMWSGADITIKDRSGQSFIDLLDNRPELVEVLRECHGNPKGIPTPPAAGESPECGEQESLEPGRRRNWPFV